MTDRELMQITLDALVRLHSTGDTQVFDMCDAPVLIPALRARLAQPEPQETIAKWIKANTEHRQWYICPKCSYQAPRFRDEWVGLTREERDEIQARVHGAVPHHVAFAHAIEQALKEKNTT